MSTTLYSNDCSCECNLLCFFENIQAIDPLLIRKYSYQGLEVFALIKSLNFFFGILN